MRKKTMLLVSFALAAVLIVGQVGFSAESEREGSKGGMMNGNGMMNMMENENMDNMMDSMNSPEGEAMTESCGNFMESYDGTEDEADVKNTNVKSEERA